jgi:hypothetical protein
VEIPAVVARVQGELDAMNVHSAEHCLNIHAYPLKPIIGFLINPDNWSESQWVLATVEDCARE